MRVHLLFLLQGINIIADPRSRTVKENVGNVEICFRITQGSIEADAVITVRGITTSTDRIAEGTLHIMFLLHL